MPLGVGDWPLCGPCREGVTDAEAHLMGTALDMVAEAKREGMNKGEFLMLVILAEIRGLLAGDPPTPHYERWIADTARAWDLV